MTVRYRSDDQIELESAKLLRQAAVDLECIFVPPIPVEDIIEKHLRVSVVIGDLKAKLNRSDVLGASYFNLNEIHVDESLDGLEARFAFTLGHELGHWILHRYLYVSANPLPLVMAAFRDSFEHQTDHAETQANKFASSLLMPTDFVRKAYRQAFRTVTSLDFVRQDREWGRIAQEVIGEGNFKNVSVEAMKYRLKKLGLVRDATQSQTQALLF